ncbi:hypothetical protein [Nonomuraea insulae]|uniref:Uncharacterized protein n=1 Tax=Nonomuraea insulae TaxID=1616787 RepID=A0ABW1CSE7_9ACTN
MRNKIMSMAAAAAAMASAVAISAFASSPANATSSAAAAWEYVASYPLTTAGQNACRAAGKNLGGDWRCRGIQGAHWSHTTSHYHLEVFE